VRWIVNIPARLMKWIRNIIRFLRKKWKAIVVAIGLCLYFVLVCALGTLIVFDSWGTSMSLAEAQDWDTLEVLITRMGLVFGGSIFFTGAVSAYSLLAGNRKWLRNSCRASAIVLLHFSIFCISVDNVDWDSTTGNFYSQEEELWQWEMNLETAGIASFYRVWKWTSASLTNLSNENGGKTVVFVYVLYSLFVSIIGVSISMVINPYFYIVLSEGPLDRAGSEEAQSIIADNLFELSLGIAIFFSGLFSLYGFVINNKKWFRDSCRVTAALFLPVAIFNIGQVQGDFIGFVIIPLLFSGDLKQLWKWILSNERVKQLMEK
jgi:hypothetical protein